jgi:hypothetical protein
MRFEHSLVFIVGMHSDLVVPHSQVQFGENFGACQFIQEFVDDWHREDILDGKLVQSPVIDTESLAAVFLLPQ